MTDIPINENIKSVLARIAKAAKDAERDPQDISLTAVSKTFPAETIELALQAGQRVFGENRVQEAQGKWPALKSVYPDVRLHLIGSLQTNKSADAVALFDVIETLDREKLAKSLAKAAADHGGCPDLFVQVNTGEEAQKGGLAPYEVVGFVDWCRSDLNMPIVGLMAIPPADEPPAPHFALLFELAAKAKLSRLSMGMSGDYETAVHLGATDVRVGSGVFGPRG
ncbi:MAG: YggS family pyridoxal phosphate-dependent enzyme [Pseudomonadota bacterium]